jgi:hypothetical protein
VIDIDFCFLARNCKFWKTLLLHMYTFNAVLCSEHWRLLSIACSFHCQQWQCNKLNLLKLIQLEDNWTVEKNGKKCIINIFTFKQRQHIYTFVFTNLHRYIPTRIRNIQVYFDVETTDWVCFCHLVFNKKGLNWSQNYDRE